MGGGKTELSGPNFVEGISPAELKEGQPLLGHAHGEAVVMVKRGNDAFAIAATCSHYGGPLAEGLVDGENIHCPWHHACFSLRTGEAVAAPALNSISCWAVDRRDGKLFVGAKKELAPKTMQSPLKRVVIVGGGAAAQAAAEMLRREGFTGSVVMLSDDASPPVDRPNLSKDYLAGNAPEEWIPLRPEEFFRDNKIELRLNTRVKSFDAKAKSVQLENGEAVAYDALLLATGAQPVKLNLPGAELSHVHTLRTLADSRAIIERAKNAKHAVVIGASFIGLEVAASLRARDIEVHVVAPEARPLEAIMGPQIGQFVRELHEEHGVNFHLQNTVKAIDPAMVTLASGEQLRADLVVVGIGVRPRIELAEAAGLKVDKGVLVNELLETSAPGVFAAGDIARWPDHHSQEPIRVEHWVVAERHGQIAAKNILGQKMPCRLSPFFWSQHYDVTLSYVGHAQKWDRAVLEGDLKQRSASVTLSAKDRALAVITVGRDLESLKTEVGLEKF